MNSKGALSRTRAKLLEVPLATRLVEVVRDLSWEQLLGMALASAGLPFLGANLGADCAGSAPESVCYPVTGECKQCSTSADCSAPTPVCDLSHSCVAGP